MWLQKSRIHTQINRFFCTRTHIVLSYQTYCIGDIFHLKFSPLPLISKSLLSVMPQQSVYSSVRSETVIISKVHKIFLGHHPCQMGKSHQCIRDHLSPHHQGLILGMESVPEMSVILNHVAHGPRFYQHIPPCTTSVSMHDNNTTKCFHLYLKTNCGFLDC